MDAQVKTGPVIVSEESMRSLLNIRHDWLLRDMFERVTMSASAVAALEAEGVAPLPSIVDVHEDVECELPARLVHVEGTDRATLMLALRLDSRLVLIEGKALIEKVKLSFIKSMGVIPLLVQAYQEDRIKRIKPLLVALERSGHEMPPPEQMQALLVALDALQ